MFCVDSKPRPDLNDIATKLGFKFHTIDGDVYWDESKYYQFTLNQIEKDIEDPTEEIGQMCNEVVARVINDEQLLRKLQIPEYFWDPIRDSWLKSEKHMYGRIDLAYNGKDPAKLYEFNADTPTSLYEAAYFQWMWLEQMVDRGHIPQSADQFNIIQEKLIMRMANLGIPLDKKLYFSCCKDTDEDRGTVMYMEDCARQAGIDTGFVFIEDIGLNAQGKFVDTEADPIEHLFKLYPYEFMFEEEYGKIMTINDCKMVEPLWKAVLSNKGMLPVLWDMFKGHPNLLPAYFAGEAENEYFDKMRQESPKAFWRKNYLPQVPSSRYGNDMPKGYARKPIFAREGANISIHQPNGKVVASSQGEYGAEGYIVQGYHPLPKFGPKGNESYTLIGSWLIGDEAAGMGIREDSTVITKDSSRFIPHIIL